MSALADKSVHVLSDVDREILKILLVPDGNIQSSKIAPKLGLPLMYNKEKTQKIGKRIFRNLPCIGY